MEELLLNKVKEKGIVQIIIEYKSEFENLEINITILKVMDELINNCINLLNN